MSLTPNNKEELRWAVLEFLATRQGAAFAPEKIACRVTKDQAVDFTFTEADVIEALTFLAGLNPARVQWLENAMGSSRYAQATSAGVLAYERGPLR